MKNNKKVIMISCFILGILSLILGTSSALFNFNILGKSGELIVGDIYMHYGESKQLNLEKLIPMENPFPTINTIRFYNHNTNMTEEEIAVCVDYLVSEWGDEIVDKTILEGETYESFCRGTGTNLGDTFQDILDNNWFYDEDIVFFEKNNIITIDDSKTEIEYIDYKLNSSMTEEEINSCVTLFQDEWQYGKDSDESWEDFCRGTGTIYGETFQEKIDDNHYNKSNQYELYKRNIIIFTEPKDFNLPYFEFTISGKNTYTKKDIYYEIFLMHGNSHATRTTRLEDEFLRFRLVEVDDNNIEKEIFNNRRYEDLENQRIWIEKIPKNTSDEYNKKYRLYAWISDKVVVGNVNQDYTIEEWEDVFTSIKVNVKGDLEEKVLTYDEKANVPDDSCFETEIFREYVLNTNMTDSELATCISMYSHVSYDEGSDPESFCLGTGTIGGMTFQVWISNYITAFGWSREDLEERNLAINRGFIKITDYDKKCGSDIAIPKEIDGYEVEMIGSNAFENKGLTTIAIPNTITFMDHGSFEDNELTSVIFEENSKLKEIEGSVFENNYLTEIEIPSSVEIIGSFAFAWNSLNEIVIPNSVKEINWSAFSNNRLTSVTFEENSILESIEDHAFTGNLIDEVDIPETVTYLACEAFDEGVIINKSDTLECEWPRNE